ncbi:hypothetical protein [Intestinimonas butyriciproducens]|uniref:hypothetical protein n=1 Tax=Intestinimonas butyriciproducens TaxID=1297617 RepID=UPI001897A5EE|nr:hypothetical protein [Intestinimonas butyriciproducens]MDB7831671.1 hypothetical protein [Intestinimonas butyriciproducens]
MTKRVSLTIGTILLIIAFFFIAVAVNHPEAAFPWSNRVTFMLYGAYIWLLFKFLIAIPFFKQQSGSLLRTILYLLMAIVFLVMEITGEKVDVYTIVRGFVVLGGVDVSLENLFLWLKERRKQL